MAIAKLDEHRRYRKDKPIAKTTTTHPEDWMLVSPTAFELASGIKVSEDELRGMREAIYEIYSKLGTHI